jgi:hypothetical protein
MERWNVGIMGDEVTIIFGLLQFADGVVERWIN